ncbi:DNA-binding transcriptional MerR regulator [Nocardioides cavernae]|uniref:DNA-binding transcriptional MerR regulator n=1 Tax=Nocardioides cavernae TaxID=1921566 RepID=A0A7Y9KR69_9ACTN|nr:DICT sensory domain-containing protein [Nocardioides cavernae]NYE38426.1 DNA-binding transcriptional MerR regulator [Nocardioides cavernae]
MDTSSRVSLTIGDLANRTGVPITTLRSWEKRYGFPQPSRQPGGHRRYSESDVDAVHAVLERRRSGLSLAAAVQRAPAAPTRSGSLFAELRRRHPVLRPQLLSRRTLVSMSHAIEDECCARAADPLLFGGFQRQTFLRPSYARWHELARTARRSTVFVDLDGAEPADEVLVEIPLPHESPLQREWFVVCDADDLPACLVAVERPGQAGAPRMFESVWSVDPVVVRDASDICAALADDLRADWRGEPDPAPLPEPVPASDDLRRATDLFDRMLDYLDATTMR